MNSNATRICAGVVASVALLAGAGGAAAADVAPFLGSWGGNGHATFTDGKRERVVCRAYYTDKPSGMGLALRCASPAYKVEIRSTLNVAGQSVTGEWEETNFNARGNVQGTLNDDRLALAVNGGGFQGRMTVAGAGRTQDVALQTSGIALKGVTVRLARLGR